uniref:Uncharacterized protein n=1 Tax=Rhizophora mucronata TaxID=61149 RepID=A0A2P2PM05_RHIMU
MLASLNFYLHKHFSLTRTKVLKIKPKCFLVKLRWCFSNNLLKR